MVRRYLPDTGEDPAGALTAVHGRLAALTGRLDAVEATVGGHGLDITALGRGLAALHGPTHPASPPAAGTGEAARKSPAGRRDWVRVDDQATATRWLTEAAQWLVEVGAHHGLDLAPCWPLHPDVVGEVFALADTRTAAYAGNPTDVAEWLTRWLPGARDRITEALAGCRGEHTVGTSAYLVADLDLEAVAGWWTRDRATGPDLALHPYLHPLDPR